MILNLLVKVKPLKVIRSRSGGYQTKDNISLLSRPSNSENFLKKASIVKGHVCLLLWLRPCGASRVDFHKLDRGRQERKR